MTFFFSSLLTSLLTSLLLFSRCNGRSVDNHIHPIISSVFVIIVTNRNSNTTTTRIMNHGHSDECRRYGLRISTSTTSICQLIHEKFLFSLGIIVGCGQENQWVRECRCPERIVCSEYVSNGLPDQSFLQILNVGFRTLRVY